MRQTAWVAVGSWLAAKTKTARTRTNAGFTVGARRWTERAKPRKTRTARTRAGAGVLANAQRWTERAKSRKTRTAATIVGFRVLAQRRQSGSSVVTMPPTSSPTETYAVCRMTRSYVNFLEGQIGRLSFLYASAILRLGHPPIEGHPGAERSFAAQSIGDRVSVQRRCCTARAEATSAH